MKNLKRSSAFIFLLITLQLIAYSQQNNETLEAVVKNAISSGVIKREGYNLVYMAAPGQDTTKIRNYYEGLIRKSGKPYTFQFLNKTAPVQTNGITNNNNNQSSQISVYTKPVEMNRTISNPNPDGSGGSGNCYNSQMVFGNLQYTDKTQEYTWTVYDGITSIKIEAWSGGGNGDALSTWEYISNGAVSTLDMVSVNGGGGGGGAYANAVIPVKPGDVIHISIPPGGGGKAVQVSVNNNQNTFYLNNGGDGGDYGLNGNGIGGVSGGVYGVFKNRLYWIGGSTGEKASLRFKDGEDWLVNFGNGGSAALLNDGGRMALCVSNIAERKDALNGGFPGGGGGGGDVKLPQGTGWPGKGAPGMVIIHY